MSEVLSSLPSGDVVSTLSTMDGGGRFSTFLRLVASSGLGELLSGEEGPITVFAPEEEAFEGWGEGELEEAEGDKVIYAVCRRHFLNKKNSFSCSKTMIICKKKTKKNLHFWPKKSIFVPRSKICSNFSS